MPRSRYSKISRRPGVHLASVASFCTKCQVLSVIVSSTACWTRCGSLYHSPVIQEAEAPARAGAEAIRDDGWSSAARKDAAHVGAVDQLRRWPRGGEAP